MSLAELQRWMLQHIRQQEPASVEGILLASEQQSASERLAVYQYAYHARLLECMRELFPVLRSMLNEAFDAFALEYLERYPPASYSLNALGTHFVQHLQETRPVKAEAGLDWIDLMLELAQLEWEIDCVFEGPGLEQVPDWQLGLQGLTPEAFSAGRLVAAPCLRLFAFQFPVNDFYTALKLDAETPLPAPQPTYLALTRRDYVVRRVPLEPTEFALLSEMIAGKPIAEALQAGATSSLRPAQVTQWFASWTRLGFIAGVERAI
jgi:hypothetical protein